MISEAIQEPPTIRDLNHAVELFAAGEITADDFAAYQAGGATPSAKPKKERSPVVYKPAAALTRDRFHRYAVPVNLTVSEHSLAACPAESNLRSLGWICHDKLTLCVGDDMVDVIVDVKLTIVGSRQLP